MDDTDHQRCTSLDYPRKLAGVLDEAERAHLARVFFERVRGRSALTYFNLLSHLAAEPEDSRGWRAVEAVTERIARELGEGYTLINDFFSFRADGERLFPTWHQDGEFWLGDDGASPGACGGFNLWILLDHRNMSYSFDVLELERNEWLYAELYARQYGLPDPRLAPPRPLFKPAEFARLSRGRGLRGLAGRAERRQPVVTNVPLEAGDALLLRQVELHRTDTAALGPADWRLALGFKVLRTGTFAQASHPSSPFGDDARKLRLGWPGLLPDFELGGEIPLVFNRTRLRELGPAARRPAWLGGLLSAGGAALCGGALLLLACCCALGAAAVWRRGVAARRRGRRRGGSCLGALLPGAHAASWRDQ